MDGSANFEDLNLLKFLAKIQLFFVNLAIPKLIFMETILSVAGFCTIVVLGAVLFIYVVVTRKKQAAAIYQAAASQESKGNYEEAIVLFEKYLRTNSRQEDKRNIENRIKTLKALAEV